MEKTFATLLKGKKDKPIRITIPKDIVDKMRLEIDDKIIVTVKK